MSKFLGGKASDIYAKPTAYPRSKFEFEVDLYMQDKSYKLERISDVSMPGHQFSTMEVNQYNIKRPLNIGTAYTPVTLTAYDTRDGVKENSIESILKKYAEYYYAGTFTSDGRAETDYASVIGNTFRDGYSGRGYKLPDEKYLIKQLVITRKSSDTDVNVITLYNPMISSVAGDQLSYQDSGPVTYRIDFAYESYDVHTINSETAATNTNSS